MYFRQFIIQNVFFADEFSFLNSAAFQRLRIRHIKKPNVLFRTGHGKAQQALKKVGVLLLSVSTWSLHLKRHYTYTTRYTIVVYVQKL